MVLQLHTMTKSFCREEKGTVASLFGLMAIVLFVMIGGAVDFGRWMHARHQTISAMDAAVLAAGRSLQVDPEDMDGAVAAAQAFYGENVQTRLSLISDSINFSVANDGKSVSAGGNAYITTPFLSLIKIEKLPILDDNGADYSTSEIASGGSAKVNIELSLMLDVTGSMSGGKIEDLKTAAKDLINIVVWDDQASYKSRISLVPFSEGVRLPPDALQNATGNRPDHFYKQETYWHWYYGQQTTNRKYYKTNCLVERTGGNAFTDAAPGDGNFVQPMYTSSSSRACLPNAENVILPLTSDKPSLISAIGALTTNGGTAGHLGTAWSWYTLSPNWNNVWGSSSHNAAPYGAASTQKIAILMTDGEYNRQYTSEGLSSSISDAALGSSSFQAQSLCGAMKQSGIIVYTVGFALHSGSSAASTLAQCASSPSKSFTAEDGDDLKQAFRAIALEISKLYLSS